MSKLSRQERKALDREIPWRTIVNGPDEVLALYIAANQKEYNSWMSWGCIVPVPVDQIPKIKATPSLRKRIVPSRNAYRDKKCLPRQESWSWPRDQGTVILGCLDPDLMVLNRSSPIPSKLAEMVLLQIASSTLSGLVELTGLKWSLWRGDVAINRLFARCSRETRDAHVHAAAARWSPTTRPDVHLGAL